MPAGNDDLFFGQPENLEQAVETLIAFYGEDEIKDLLHTYSHSDISIGQYPIPEFIRNTWFLWWREDHRNKWFPISKPPLVAFFHSADIVHPDDMSSIILSAVWHQLQHKPYNLMSAVQQLQGYWKEQGFQDDKPDNHAI